MWLWLPPASTTGLWEFSEERRETLLLWPINDHQYPTHEEINTSLKPKALKFKAINLQKWCPALNYLFSIWLSNCLTYSSKSKFFSISVMIVRNLPQTRTCIKSSTAALNWCLQMTTRGHRFGKFWSSMLKITFRNITKLNTEVKLFLNTGSTHCCSGSSLYFWLVNSSEQSWY